MFNFTKFEDLLKETGVTKKHICQELGVGNGYFSDCQAKNVSIPKERVKTIASILRVHPSELSDDKFELENSHFICSQIQDLCAEKNVSLDDLAEQMGFSNNMASAIKHDCVPIGFLMEQIQRIIDPGFLTYTHYCWFGPADESALKIKTDALKKCFEEDNVFLVDRRTARMIYNISYNLKHSDAAFVGQFISWLMDDIQSNPKVYSSFDRKMEFIKRYEKDENFKRAVDNYDTLGATDNFVESLKQTSEKK